MKTRWFLIGLLLAAETLIPAESVASAPGPRPARLLRHPTYSEGQVAFGYLGDLWIAREDGSGVRRLTDHKARDVYPRFSPDGKRIAFSSNREGNYDVYVIATEGGKPRQLTFHTADDMVVGWTPDGAKIIFQSTRAKGVFPSVATLWEIAVEGGMEQPIATDWGSWASYSPDGTKLAFTRHPGVWSRKHYRGSYAVDLWLMDVAAKKFTKLGDDDYQGNHLWPMYGRNGEIYFVADRLAKEKNVKFAGPEVMKSANNIWKISERGGKPVQVTHHTDGNLFFPSLSADGRTIVYEDNFGLWKLDLASDKSSEIRIQIVSDVKDNEVELRAQSEADGFNLSPSNKRAAITTHGEIWTIATDRGDVQRVSETPWREREPHWAPNGKRIAFVSDRSGREEVWIADELGHNLKQLSDADCDKSTLAWAPDSKSLLWAGSDFKLRRVEIESGKTEVLVSSDVGAIGTPQFSPDGKWISYSKPDALLRSRIFVKPLDGGAERMIDSESFLVASGAKWTPDGKKLVFLAGYGAPSMASLNRTTLQLYSVPLTRVEKNPDDRDVDTEAQADAASDTSRRGRGSDTNAPSRGEPSEPAPDGVRTGNARRPGESASTKVEVKIDWDGLERRIRKLTSMGGSVASVVPSPDSRTYAFVASGGSDEGSSRPALYTIAEGGTNLTLVTQGAPPESSEETPRGRGGFGGGFADVQWAKDSRSLYYLQGGGIYSVSVSGGSSGESGAVPSGSGFGGRGLRGMRSSSTAAPAESSSSTPRRISFTVRMEVDEVAERRQVFEEAWRVMKNRFYDPQMHGVNWAAAKENYEPLLADVADTDELHTVIMEMIGELNASHTGISGGGDRESRQERVQTRYPGFDLEPDSSGYYKVMHLYKKGPADHDYVKLATGNFILAVNGKELKTSDNYWKRFNLLPGRKFEFRVNSKPETNGAWTVSLEPISGTTQGNLDYERWVDSRRAQVEKLSKNEIGYLHIKAMDSASYEKFQRDLMENQDKKALIIDQRFNGGGGIDQELLEILNQRKRYETYRPRGSVTVPRPARAFFGPMVVLQNERSASNAEMFPEGFRTLGLGKVIGVTTYGAVIGTGSYRLLDGSSIRTPGFGVFTAKGENFENYGVPPDVAVDNTPEDFLAGRDRQIEKAVEVLRAEMK
ncbi:MAG: PD40 domain-containing protein [Verrucomicrobia bacterium]|nr:PD40 domain-containing protein [Verrucomicrobiota bacterium]